MVFVKMPASLVEGFKKKNCLFYTWGQDEGYIFGRLVPVLTQRKRKLIGFWELRRSWRTNIF